MNETHDHKEELKFSNELLTELQGSIKKVNHMKKEEPRASRTLVLALSASRLQEHPKTHKEPFLRMRGMEDHSRAFTR